MTIIIIIVVCVLLLSSYLFDYTSSHTRIPSVILLLLLGWIIKQLTGFFEINVPDFSSILPVLGTVGLILIVLEASLELEMNRSKTVLIQKTFFGALLPLLVLTFLLALLFQYFGESSFRNSVINAIPLCIISSAIAIPTVIHFDSTHKEYITYESSFSDISGILLFNFLIANEILNLNSLGKFGIELLIITVISFLASLGLAFLMHNIEHRIKFFPIILLVILIYSVSKFFHLPALIFILIFGLFLGNLDEFRKIKWINKLHPEELDIEASKFKEFNIEATFLIRSLFFLLFGYLIDTSEVLNTDTIVWSAGIVFVIFIFRAVQLKLSNYNLKPLLFIAPRGLITILLFLSIEPSIKIPIVNKSLIIQVILLTTFIMMIGVIVNKAKPQY